MSNERNIWRDVEKYTPQKKETSGGIKRLGLFVITISCFFIGYYMWLKHSNNTIAIPIALGVFSFILTLNYHKINGEKDVWVLFSMIVVATEFFYQPILATLLFPLIRFMSSLKEKE